jgi:hypothetical protein
VRVTFCESGQGFVEGFFTALIVLAFYTPMSEWKNEDDIKAELRAMTDELRKLREGLRNLVSPPKTNPSRAFLHRQAWPSAAEPARQSAADDKRPKVDRPKPPKRSR